MATKSVLCPVCKKQQMYPSSKRCRVCYYARTGKELEPLSRHPRHCMDCGTEISRTKGVKRCGVCYPSWRKRMAAKGTAPAVAPREPLSSFEEAWSRWEQAIGKMRDRYAGPPKRPPGREHITVVPDIHAPFHVEEYVAELCAREGPIATKAIAIGDISDAYAFSVFTKYERVSFSEEWASVHAVVQALSESFHEVEIVVGNHDARLEKRVRERLTEDQVDAVRYMTGGTLCPLTALAKAFPNVTIARHDTPDGHQINWFTTVGDAWLGHPSTFSSVPGNALRKLENWLLDNEGPMGMDRYRLVVLGHTHQLSCIPWRSDTMLLECGCLCAQQFYQTSDRLGGRPQKRGFVWFEQDDGVTDLNSVGWHWFDVAK